LPCQKFIFYEKQSVVSVLGESRLPLLADCQWSGCGCLTKLAARAKMAVPGNGAPL
jgi:hypothetical protein